MATAIPEPAKHSVVVMVGRASWVEPLLRWARYEADNRRSRLRVLYLPDSGDARATTSELESLDKMVRRLLSDREVDVVRMYQPSRESGETGIATTAGDMILVGPIDRNTLVHLVFEPAYDSFDCPVVVVPDKALTAGPPASGPPMITVGFHGSRPSAAALDWAITEAARRGAVVEAVLAWWEGPNGGLCGAVPLDPHLHALAGAAARALAVATVGGTGLPVERVNAVARRGDPSRVLVKEAAEADLLVVGAGQSVVHHHRVLGPTTLGCLAHSPVPVAIVHNQTTDDDGSEPGRRGGAAVDTEQLWPLRPQRESDVAIR